MDKVNASYLERMTRVLDMQGRFLDRSTAIPFINSLERGYADDSLRVRLTLKPYVGDFSADVINGGILRGVEEGAPSNILWIAAHTDQDSVGINIDIIERVEIFVPEVNL